jgi:hypothetical protein
LIPKRTSICIVDLEPGSYHGPGYPGGFGELRCGMGNSGPRPRRALPAVGLVLALAGCSGTAHEVTVTGTVHGAIVQVGGPSGAEPGHPAGAVTVTRAGRPVAEQRVAEGDEFRFILGPGSYRLTVNGVDGCAPADVTVPATAGDQAIELTCQRK